VKNLMELLRCLLFMHVAVVLVDNICMLVRLHTRSEDATTR